MDKDSSGLNSSTNGAGGRWLRLGEVQSSVGLGRSSIYAKIQHGSFPKPIKIGPRVSVWPESAIESWKRQQLEASNGGAK